MNRSASLTLAIALSAGCRSPEARPVAAARSTPTVTVSAVAAPSAAPAATPVLPVDAQPPEYDVFVSKDPAEDWRIEIERRGAEARAIVHEPFVDGFSFLRGAVRDDGRFHFAGAGMTLDGGLGPDRLEATCARDGASDHLALVKRKKLDAASFVSTFAGGAGARRFRLVWTQKDFVVDARLRFLGEAPHELRGTVDRASGAARLVEKDASGRVLARLDGVLMSEHAALGRLALAGATETLAMELGSPAPTWSYPDDAKLPSGGAVVAREDFAARGRCWTSYVYPQIVGAPSLDAPLRAFFGGGKPTCAGPSWEAATYAVRAVGRDWVSLGLTGYSYMGGAHGVGWDRCVVARPSDGKLVQLGAELTPASRAKLAALVRASILADARAKNPSVKTLVDVGFSDEHPVMDANRPLCVTGDRGALSLEVLFEEDEGMFRPLGPPSARLDAATARALFPPGSVGATVFAAP